MRFRKTTVFLMAAASLAGFAQSSAANPFFSFFDSELAPAPPIGVWQTTVSREPTARDAGWPASVVAMAPSHFTTGSIARSVPRAQTPGPRINGATHTLAGNASYYWEDQMTATGEHFNKRDMTAAHKTLPFGTRVRVTRVDNGDSVVVRINDRGPYKPGRIIDLSERAAENLGMTSAGIAPVRLEVLGQ